MPSVIHEYHLVDMPKRRILELREKGAKVYKICENPDCDWAEQYVEIVSDAEFMTYCLRCARKVLKYGVEIRGGPELEP